MHISDLEKADRLASSFENQRITFPTFRKDVELCRSWLSRKRRIRSNPVAWNPLGDWISQELQSTRPRCYQKQYPKVPFKESISFLCSHNATPLSKFNGSSRPSSSYKISVNLRLIFPVISQSACCLLSPNLLRKSFLQGWPYNFQQNSIGLRPEAWREHQLRGVAKIVSDKLIRGQSTLQINPHEESTLSDSSGKVVSRSQGIPGQSRGDPLLYRRAHTGVSQCPRSF